MLDGVGHMLSCLSHGGTRSRKAAGLGRPGCGCLPAWLRSGSRNDDAKLLRVHSGTRTAGRRWWRSRLTRVHADRQRRAGRGFMGGWRQYSRQACRSRSRSSPSASSSPRSGSGARPWPRPPSLIGMDELADTGREYKARARSAGTRRVAGAARGKPAAFEFTDPPFRTSTAD